MASKPETQTTQPVRKESLHTQTTTLLRDFFDRNLQSKDMREMAGLPAFPANHPPARKASWLQAVFFVLGFLSFVLAFTPDHDGSNNPRHVLGSAGLATLGAFFVGKGLINGR